MAVAVAESSERAAVREITESRGATVAISHISHIFEAQSGPLLAIDDISLDVGGGEFVVIVGPSGCGKTTLLRIIAGLEQPTSGVLKVESQGAETTRNSMVFQGRSVFPWLTVEENVGYGLKLTGRRGSARRAVTSDLLTLIGLSRFGKSYPDQLSEGMRQRVALARALAVDPRLLLMDEPFGALDEQTRFILQEELLRIWESTRKTVVLVTHSIDEALTLADRVIVMTAQPGRIKAIVPVPFARPRSQATVRSDPQFAGMFSQIWDLLRDEVQQSRLADGEAPR